MAKTERMNIRLKKETKEKLEQMATEEKRSMNEIIEFAIEERFERRKNNGI